MSVQAGFFGLIFLALAVSLAAIRRPQIRSRRRVARFFWGVGLIYFAAMWCGGAALELMQRAQNLPLESLLIALAAFSILLGGVWSLVREWFGSDGTLDCRRIAWTVVWLSLAGWFFGGLALPQNGFFQMGQVKDFPAGWLLALGGAQLLGAARLVQSPFESARVVIHVPTATAWLAISALGLGWLPLEDSLALLTVFGSGALPFLGLIWHAKLRSQAALGPWVGRTNWRALLLAVVVSLPVSLVLFGVVGALFWLFFPLAGLFFDLLGRDESLAKATAFPEFEVGGATGIPADGRQVEAS